MATIDVGGLDAGKRALNHEPPLIPYIDFLLCLISFLLITAVWSQQARLAADPQVPGANGCIACGDEHKLLHVDVRDSRFVLTWREGETVVASSSVARKPVTLADGSVTYPELASRLAEEWRANGSHRNPTDKKRDRAVLHTTNALEFGEVIAVMDAMTATKRTADVPAFDVSFATN
jgi:biopolymer transport protein ExbD